MSLSLTTFMQIQCGYAEGEYGHILFKCRKYNPSIFNLKNLPISLRVHMASASRHIPASRYVRQRCYDEPDLNDLIDTIRPHEIAETAFRDKTASLNVGLDIPIFFAEQGDAYWRHIQSGNAYNIMSGYTAELCDNRNTPYILSCNFPYGRILYEMCHYIYTPSDVCVLLPILDEYRDRDHYHYQIQKRTSIPYVDIIAHIIANYMTYLNGYIAGKHGVTHTSKVPPPPSPSSILFDTSDGQRNKSYIVTLYTTRQIQVGIVFKKETCPTKIPMMSMSYLNYLQLDERSKYYMHYAHNIPKKLVDQWYNTMYFACNDVQSYYDYIYSYGQSLNNDYLFCVFSVPHPTGATLRVCNLLLHSDGLIKIQKLKIQKLVKLICTYGMHITT